MKSRSMSRRWPTPARTSALASTVPRAPQPHSVTRAVQQPALACLADAVETHLPAVSFQGFVHRHASSPSPTPKSVRNVLRNCVSCFGHFSLPGEGAQAGHVLAHLPQPLALQPLQVAGDVLQRLLGGGGMDDVLVRAGEENGGVQHGQQQRIDAQLRGNEREDGGAVRGLVVGSVSLRPPRG